MGKLCLPCTALTMVILKATAQATEMLGVRQRRGLALEERSTGTKVSEERQQCRNLIEADVHILGKEMGGASGTAEAFSI